MVESFHLFRRCVGFEYYKALLTWTQNQIFFKIPKSNSDSQINFEPNPRSNFGYLLVWFLRMGLELHPPNTSGYFVQAWVRQLVAINDIVWFKLISLGVPSKFRFFFLLPWASLNGPSKKKLWNFGDSPI